MPADIRYRLILFGLRAWPFLEPLVRTLLESRTHRAYIDAHSRTIVLRTHIISATICLAAFTASAQIATDNHLVTVTVSPISVVQITGAGVTFNVGDADALAGQDLMVMTDASTQLLWGTNSSAQKITVATNLGTPLFVLKLVAVGPTIGTAGAESTLSTIPSDLLLDIGRSSGSCSLRYTAEVLASLGTGTDSHTITFTMVAQ